MPRSSVFYNCAGSDSGPRVADELLNGYEGLVADVWVLVRHELHHSCLAAEVGEDSVENNDVRQSKRAGVSVNGGRTSSRARSV